MTDINDTALSYSNLISQYSDLLSQYSDLRSENEKIKMELEQSIKLVAALSKSANTQHETYVSLCNQNVLLSSAAAHFNELTNAYYAFIGCSDALALILTSDDDYSSWNGDYIDVARQNLTRLFHIAITEIIESSVADRLELAAAAQNDFRPASNVDEIPF